MKPLTSYTCKLNDEQAAALEAWVRGHNFKPREVAYARFTGEGEKADLLILPAPLLRRFGDATIPTAEQIHTFQRQITNLRWTRDLLLPDQK